MGVIACKLGRKVKRGVKEQTFPGDWEAQGMMTKRYREPWTLPAV